jgi:uncharacterized protein (DUF427 family)
LKAIWNSEVIADSSDTVVVEGNHYFPLEAIRKDFLESSAHTSHCPWKGVANYYTLKIGDKRNENAAWYYDAPLKAAENIRGRVAFWKGVNVSE